MKAVIDFIWQNLSVLILIYLIIINTAAFVACGLDKYNAANGLLRISEKKLYLLSFFGGAFFMLLGMIIFRHKTRKTGFVVLIPLLLLFHLILLLIFQWRYESLSNLFSRIFGNF